MKIIVTESIAKEGIDFLRESGFEVDVVFGISGEELLKIIDQYDALIVRSVTKVNAELLERAVNLKVVGRAGNGVDNIDLKLATRKGIIVVNTPESNTMAAAELAITLSYAIFRNLVQAVSAGRVHDFRRGKVMGYELDGKTYPDDLGASMPLDKFYQAMENGASTRTSQISIAEYQDYFEKYLKEGKDILHIDFSSGLSGSVNSARNAAEMLKEKYPEQKIYVLDSLAASSGYGLLVDKAADLRDEGMDIDTLAKWVDDNKLCVRGCLFKGLNCKNH